MNNFLLCVDSVPKDLYFFDFSVAPRLMLYSYVPAILVSLFLGFFIMIKSKFSMQGKLIFCINLFFSFWVFNYIIQWTIAYATPDLFSWKLTPIFMLLMFFSAAYFSYVYLEKRDVPFGLKILASLFFLPIIIFIPTRFNMSFFNLTMCEGVSGILWTYIYLLEALIILAVIFLGFKRYILTKNDNLFRKQIIFLSIGIVLFLSISLFSDVIGEITKKYQLNFIGPIGMVLLLGFISFLIVRYKAFNIKLLGTQALVVALIILVGSELFFAENYANKIIILVTLFISSGFGYILIRSVKKEVQRKEELQNMSNSLAMANDKLRKLDNAKSEFISIASHQLRTPLTAIKGFVSLLLEGSYGKISAEVKETLNKVYISNERLIALVESLLNLSRIESGRMEYKFEKVKLDDVCKEIYDTFAIRAKEKNLYLEVKVLGDFLAEVTTDKGKIREVISNLVDNALKYTIKGGVKIKLSDAGEKIRVAISDTGIGVPEEEIPYLFSKFSRGKDINRLNAGGTGLGLHVGKKMMESLHGEIGVESAGANMGSTFFVEVPKEVKEE